MAILRISDMREMSVEQIDEKLKEIETDLGKMKSQVRSGGAPENPGKMRDMRKTAAKLLTIKSQKLNEEPQKKQ
jgi:large subunit ribosomal protein L29